MNNIRTIPALKSDVIFAIGYYRKFFGTTISANRAGT